LLLPDVHLPGVLHEVGLRAPPEYRILQILGHGGMGVVFLAEDPRLRRSIFNQATHPKFPLLGLRFKNTSGLHLMQGPITVSEGSAYAGDSPVLDLQPNEERLLSYAVDLGTEVEAVTENPRTTLTTVKAVRGLLYTTTRLVESKTYRAKNRSDKDRTLLIEHPYRADFHLTSKDQPAERARDV
jgi:hypothetical protein